MTGDVASAVRLSVPGKVILMGEHAAVYGRPAVVAAVGRRLAVEGDLEWPAGKAESGRVQLDLPDLGLDEEHSWGAIDEFTGRARRRWQAFRRGEASFRPADELSALVRIAVGEAVTSLPAPAASRLRGRTLGLRLRSQLPVGAGLGSSAAAAVGVVAAVRALAGSRVRSPDELAAIEAAALEVERRQHGFPSGIDSGTVLRGGVLLVRREGDRLRFDDLPRPEWLRGEVEILDSGTPGQTTGAVVTAVRRRYDNEPERTAAVFDRIEAAVESFRAALRDGGPRAAAAAIADGHRALVELGVVPPAVARRIASVEAAGGAAKISGAGALEGESAGALICMLAGRSAGTIDGISGLEPVNAAIGAGGLRFESRTVDRR
ncbi:MAG: hypothetical protein F4X59_03440 [Holophagales bacterium]|nr:hypothetical protein [Holophagales bacterium]MXX62090.1 hypothetical protein [Holophagales bacterium]MYC09162.1 hypothetical protein [Holophagales bacterium]MYD22946.1 hypothetical protein [Holophagales bacterium]